MSCVTRSSGCQLAMGERRDATQCPVLAQTPAPSSPSTGRVPRNGRGRDPTPDQSTDLTAGAMARRWHLFLLLWIGSVHLCARGFGRFNALPVGRALEQDRRPHMSIRSSPLSNLFPARLGTWSSFEEYSASFDRTNKRNKKTWGKHRGKWQWKKTRLRSPSPFLPVELAPTPSPTDPASPASSPPALSTFPPEAPPTAPPPQAPQTPPITRAPAAPTSLPQRLPSPLLRPEPTPDPSPSTAPSDAPPALSLNTSRCGVCGNLYAGGVGDTLSSLSKTCNVDLGLLQQANPGVDDAEGRTVNLPCTGTDPADCGPCGAFYFIKYGDDLEAIAAKCRVLLQDLHQANKDLIVAATGDPELYPGQYISVPCGQPQLARSTSGCGDCGIFYRAKEAVSVDIAARTCRVSNEGLLAANPALRNESSVLRPGQLISVPCFGESSRQCGLCGASYIAQDYESLAAVSAKCRTKGLEAANPKVHTEVPPNFQLIVTCGTSLSPRCSPCSPEVKVNDSSLDTMAQLCQVPAELLQYANGILPGQAKAPLQLGQNLSVPCAELPAPSSACSACGSTFLVTQSLQVSALALACGVDEMELYTRNNLSKSAIVEANSVLQLPCEQPAVGCGPCGLGYFPVEDEELPAVSVRCRVYPNLIKAENPQIADFSVSLVNKALNMPCKMNVLDAGLSLDPQQHARDMVPLLLASGGLALLHLLG